MRRRPQPNRVRGFLRAGVVVVVLLIIVVVVIEVVTSLTAPPAHAPAPTVLPTPGTAVVPTPGHTTTATKTRTPTPRKTPSKDVTLGGSPSKRQSSFALDSVRQRSSGSRLTPFVAMFSGPSDAYRSVLFIRSRSGATSRRIGLADRFVTPVWSSDAQSLLYVRVTATRHDPGARWSLWSYRLGAASPQRLASVSALNLTPLGWRGRHPAFMVTTGSDSSLFETINGRVRFQGIVIPQPVTYGSLSPSGRWIAVTAPASCTFCTLDMYDTASKTLAIGTSGMPRETEMAWTVDGRALITVMRRRLVAVDPRTLVKRTLTWPHGLPSIWSHPMRAQLSARTVILTDLITGQTYRSNVASS